MTVHIEVIIHNAGKRSDTYYQVFLKDGDVTLATGESHAGAPNVQGAARQAMLTLKYFMRDAEKDMIENGLLAKDWETSR